MSNIQQTPNPPLGQNESSGITRPQSPTVKVEHGEHNERPVEQFNFQMHPLGYFIDHTSLQSLHGLSFQWLVDQNIAPGHLFAFSIFYGSPAFNSFEQQLHLRSSITHFFNALIDAIVPFIDQGITLSIPLRDYMRQVYSATCRTYSNCPAFRSLLVEVPFMIIIDIFLISRMAYFKKFPAAWNDRFLLADDCLAAIDNFDWISQTVRFLGHAGQTAVVYSRKKPTDVYVLQKPAREVLGTTLANSSMSNPPGVYANDRPIQVEGTAGTLPTAGDISQAFSNVPYAIAPPTAPGSLLPSRPPVTVQHVQQPIEWNHQMVQGQLRQELLESPMANLRHVHYHHVHNPHYPQSQLPGSQPTRFPG